jgi:methylmalonyl-CoA mutase N-terminal domain/subunit
LLVNDDEIARIREALRGWESGTLRNTVAGRPEQSSEFATVSGIPAKVVYTPLDTASHDYLVEVGFPGTYPFTRGIHATMYRGRLWTRRQVVGLGTARDTNLRHKYVLSQGQTGLSNDFDLPTLTGYDSDHPAARNEVGRIGVAIDTLRDMELLFDGIPLDKVSVSFTINHPAPVILAMYIALAQNRGIGLAKLDGTIQNDPLKEFFAQKTYVFPPRPSLRIVSDILDYCSRQMPRWNTISICHYQTRDSGATVDQELAFAFAAGIEYIKTAIESGLAVDDFAPRLSFLGYVHNDFLEEIAKFRAARRIWAEIVRGRFGAKNPASWKYRVHVQTGGSTLTYQQPEVNICRGTIQALAAVLGGTQSMAVSAYDEALSIPSEKSQRMSLRIQQVIAHESGVVNTVDPLGGSYYIEYLTDAIEDRVWEWLDRIEKRGGMVPCVESGYIEQVIANEAHNYQKDIQSKKRIVVGVNEYVLEEETLDIETFRVDPAVEQEQITSLERVRDERDAAAVEQALERVHSALVGQDNMMPPIIDAVKAYATEGEIIAEMKKVLGEHKPLNVY